MSAIIEIDESSGFCFGVINAINHAEKELERNADPLYCLGDIVHNNLEVNRLAAKGMQTVDYEGLKKLHGARVLFRAHGEPPEIYKWAEERNLKLVDATCPVVKKLQQNIRRCYLDTRHENAQIVIYGKPGHAEVNGLMGHTDGNAIVVRGAEDLHLIDPERPVVLFSQTTKPLDGFSKLTEAIRKHLKEGVRFEYKDTICRQVSNRIPHIRRFAAAHDLVYFVAGTKSSNGKVLFQHCHEGNPRSIFISSPEEIELSQLSPAPKTIGICGATSTPKWQMEQVAQKIKELLPDSIMLNRNENEQ